MTSKIKREKRPIGWPVYYFVCEDGTKFKRAHPVICSLCHSILLRHLPFAFCENCPFIVCGRCGLLLDKADTDLHKMVEFSSKKPLSLDVDDVENYGVKVVKIDGYYGRSPRLCHWPV